MPPASVPGPDYEAVFAAVPGNFLLLDPALTIIGVSEAYLAATSTVRAEILGRGLFEVFPDNPDDPAADGVRNLQASLRRVLEHRRPDRMPLQKYDIRRPAQEGGGFEERYWSPLNAPVLAPDGSVQSIIHWVENVTDFVRLKRETENECEALNQELRARASRIEAETYLRVEALEANRRLQESERRYRFLANAVPQLIWTADPEGGLDYCNERWSAVTGLAPERLRGDGWLQALHPEDLEPTRAAWLEAVGTSAPQFQVEHRVRHSDGTWRWMLTTAVPYRDAGGRVLEWYAATTDIHDRVSAEEQLRHTRQLQAVGQLAGGMAHEVNNMMSAVLGFGELALAGLGPDHPHSNDVREMILAGARAAQVTRQLLAFSRQQVLKPAVIDLNTIVTELTPALQNLLGSDRRLEIILSAAPVRVVADHGQLEQVLINLTVNARDATVTNGVIIVETGLLEGRLVRLAVRDNGSGMSADTVARAFEPFFTTKPVGKGTGLGLSMVHGIARQSGGDVRIDSVLGAGTEVAVLLPPAEGEVAETTPIRSRHLPRGLETVLVVEDEGVVRSLVRRVLENQGYVVYQAPNGRAALDFLASRPGVVHLVLTDIVMPLMNGLELAGEIRQRFPSLPVLFMSGYSGTEMAQRGLALTDVPFLQKPLTIEALATAVRDRLDRAGALQILS
ncbi:MAG TPA: response regulator [Gemmatimonadales bacterium]|nr:response regulator [Gemmatimonadales bacterium]